jgi:FixJ family two-component response regulator
VIKHILFFKFTVIEKVFFMDFYIQQCYIDLPELSGKDFMRKNVLLIDESHTIPKIVELTLEKQSYELFSAYNAEEGLALASSNDIDCILIDVLIVNEDPTYIGKLTSFSSKTVIVPLVNTFNQFQDLNNKYPFITNHVVKPFNAPALNLVLELAVGKAGEQRKQDAEERAAESKSDENVISYENTDTVSEENIETESKEEAEEAPEDDTESAAPTETDKPPVEAERALTDSIADQTAITDQTEETEDGPENTDSENLTQSDETPPLTSFQDRYGDIPEEETFPQVDSEVTRNDLVLDTIEQDVELEILQDYMVKSEEDSEQSNENVYGDISLSDAGKVPDVSTVIDIMDKVIATEQIDTDLGKLELELSDESFSNEDISESFMGYGDVEFNEKPASEEEAPVEDLKTDDNDDEFKGVMVELGETNEALFTSDKKEREEIMEVFASDEKNEQAAGFKKIAEKTVSADKAPVARLYFELPKDEFVEIFKRYLDKNTIDFLLHDTVKSILDKILSETLEKSVRKELERIIKGN